MTPVLTTFLNRLTELGGNADNWSYILEDERPILILPAKHEEVGPLTVYDDGDELTIVIGTKYHSHFPGYSYEGETEEDELLAAARDAADFTCDVLADRVCITNDFLDGKCIGASLFYLEIENTAANSSHKTNTEQRGGNIETQRFIWSGPVD